MILSGHAFLGQIRSCMRYCTIGENSEARE